METLYNIRLNESDAERVVAALRAQAKITLERYTTELLNQGPGTYADLIYDDYGLLVALADDIEWLLPE
jgi:hypothetical protein